MTSYESQIHPEIIGTSQAFRRVLALVPKAAMSDAPVLITGETGTGKEVLAQAIHYTGPRASWPFTAVQCAAFAHDLFESELFGHESGAFTGAGSATIGLVTASDKGTLFLDEIDSLGLDLQAKILRLVEEHEYRRVGSSKSRRADIRIVAATNADLEALTGKGAFRQDLYFRIKGISLSLPPLRERGDDVLLLAKHFLKRYSEKSGREAIRLSDRALFRLMAYEWPGNVRQLARVIEQAITFCEKEVIDAESLDLPNANAPAGTMPFKTAKALAIRSFERSYFSHTLLSSDWNISEAARKARMARTAFLRKIRELGIRRPNVEPDDPEANI